METKQTSIQSKVHITKTIRCLCCHNKVFDEDCYFILLDKNRNIIPYTQLQVFCSKKCKIRYKRRHAHILAHYKIRLNVFKRDNFKCVYCGRNPVEDNIKLELDHIIPTDGKGTDWLQVKEEDFVTSCKDCNIGKGNRILTMEMIKEIHDRIKNHEEA